MVVVGSIGKFLRRVNFRGGYYGGGGGGRPFLVFNRAANRYASG